MDAEMGRSEHVRSRAGGATAGRILVVGGGFAGVWSALAAARVLAEEGFGAHVRVTLVSSDPYLTIRPRLYESDLEKLRIPLDRLLTPAGVGRMLSLIHI